MLAGGGVVLRAGLGLWPTPALAGDPMLVLAVLAALPGRMDRALGAALFAGVLQDAWLGRWYGEFAFIYLVVVFFLSLLAGWVDLVQPFSTMLALAAATAASWGLQLGLAAAFDRPAAQIPGVGMWIVAILLNTALGLLARALAIRWKGFET
ncbi:MAG: hypothetical protein Q9Q13_09695 [Acidobacteriota bacterium]|nr:hypothetical protein [Acidobacteriota bacterium]